MIKSSTISQHLVPDLQNIQSQLSTTPMRNTRKSLQKRRHHCPIKPLIIPPNEIFDINENSSSNAIINDPSHSYLYYNNIDTCKDSEKNNNIENKLETLFSKSKIPPFKSEILNSVSRIPLPKSESKTSISAARTSIFETTHLNNITLSSGNNSHHISITSDSDHRKSKFYLNSPPPNEINKTFFGDNISPKVQSKRDFDPTFNPTINLLHKSKTDNSFNNQFFNKCLPRNGSPSTLFDSTSLQDIPANQSETSSSTHEHNKLTSTYLLESYNSPLENFTPGYNIPPFLTYTPTKETTKHVFESPSPGIQPYTPANETPSSSHLPIPHTPLVLRSVEDIYSLCMRTPSIQLVY